jgi:multidrug resistance efflux pump
VLLTAFTYSVCGKIDIVVTGNAVARPASHIIKILSDRNGFLERIFIQEGQTINKNTPLFLIRSKEGLTYRSKIDELAVLIPIKQEYFDTKISAALAKLEQLQMNFNNSIRIKKLKLSQVEQELKSIDSDIAYWQKECEFCKTDIARFQRLLQSGSVAERELAYAKIRHHKVQSEVTKLT